MFFSGLAVFRRTIPQFRSFATKESGTVKWFDVKKGFGFIAPQDGGKDVFVHQTVIHANGFRSLAEGETVEFTVQNDETGRLKATLVTGPMGAFVQGMPKPAFSQSRGGGDSNYGFGGGRHSAPKMDDYDDQEWASSSSTRNDFADEDEPKSDNYNNKN